MKWIGAAACVLIYLAVGLVFFRNTPPSLSQAAAGCTVADAPSRSRGVGASLCFPGEDATRWDYFQTAHETCAGQRVENLARQLETKPQARSVAEAYAGWMRTEAPGRTPNKPDLAAVYTGCLKGLEED